MYFSLIWLSKGSQKKPHFFAGLLFLFSGKICHCTNIGSDGNINTMKLVDIPPIPIYINRLLSVTKMVKNQSNCLSIVINEKTVLHQLTWNAYESRRKKCLIVWRQVICLGINCINGHMRTRAFHVVWCVVNHFAEPAIGQPAAKQNVHKVGNRLV